MNRKTKFAVHATITAIFAGVGIYFSAKTDIPFALSAISFYIVLGTLLIIDTLQNKK